MKLMIYRLIYVLPLTRGQQLWVVTEEMRLWIQAAEFLLKSEGSALEIIIAEYYCQISSMHLNKTFDVSLWIFLPSCRHNLSIYLSM